MRILPLLIILSFFSSVASAYDRGDKLLWACKADPSKGVEEALGKAHCIGYVTGMVDSAQLIFSVTPESRLFCPPSSGMSGDQQVRIVVKWLENHPEELHKGGRVSVVLALKEAFPCK